ncbi:MAG: shikimate dehydrogenase [Candidatus Omnitrophica bacterium CG07_land_8_20_14_0_80_42_15]|uniref:Shikimate dehydrogenase n=1 Tax=Candidatus Aquitaenariimonas noxiae TaxID=1974741 RepID=A0A2J0KV56_9BACT|nr:MAG: shikimate dehydrogenase [Candidatus Omnitrophica bacterium CG07_land_8_20_14_0_80_42_15]
MKNKFAFIGHPIDLNHLYGLLGIWGKIAKRMPRDLLYKITLNFPPYKYCDIEIESLTKDIASGYALICPLLPYQVAFLEESVVIKKIIEVAKLAERLGAKIAVLGGFASIVGNEGEEVSKNVNIAVTSGNTYTACLAIEGIEKAAEKMDLDLSESVMAVIGATGDIGSICTKIFSKKVKKINIAARNEKRLNEFAEVIRDYGNCPIEVKRTRDAIKEADIILTVTSAVSVLIDPEDLKPGCVVCDVAIPANVAKEVVNIRNDVLVFEGGLARYPFMENTNSKKWKKVMPPNSVFGCLAEGILLTLEERFENYSLGRGNITEEKINEMFAIEKKHGFGVADFFCGYKLFNDEDIQRIKGNAFKKKEEVNVAKR